MVLGNAPQPLAFFHIDERSEESRVKPIIYSGFPEEIYMRIIIIIINKNGRLKQKQINILPCMMISSGKRLELH